MMLATESGNVAVSSELVQHMLKGQKSLLGVSGCSCRIVHTRIRVQHCEFATYLGTCAVHSRWTCTLPSRQVVVDTVEDSRAAQGHRALEGGSLALVLETLDFTKVSLQHLQ